MTRIRIFVRSLFKNRVTSVITIAGFFHQISLVLVITVFLVNEFVNGTTLSILKS